MRSRAARYRLYRNAAMSCFPDGRWSPLSLGSSLAAWYRADGVLWQDSARTTRVTADSDPVGCWDDASGNARHLLQTDNGLRPTWVASDQNGKPVVRGSGSAQYLVTGSNLTLAQPLAWFAAFHYAAGGGSGAMVYGVNGNAPAIYQSSNTFAAFAGSGVTAGADDAAWHVHSVVFNGASSAYYIDGAADSISGNPGAMGYSAGSATDGPLSMFANTSPGFYGAGDMGEALLLNRAPTMAEINQIRAYLKSVYATP